MRVPVPCRAPVPGHPSRTIANHGNISPFQDTPLQFEFQPSGTLIGRSVEGGRGKSGDEHRREDHNYLVGANRTFDLAGSLAPIGARLAGRGWF
jgi:hypothetical protein